MELWFSSHLGSSPRHNYLIIWSDCFIHVFFMCFLWTFVFSTIYGSKWGYIQIKAYLTYWVMFKLTCLLPVQCFRYLLKHNKFDGVETILQAYGKMRNRSIFSFLFCWNLDVDDDSIKAFREASIVTAIELSEEGMIAISTSDADSDDEANTVTFTPGTATNISNPLNGETVEVGSLHFPF